eukprot:4789089-Pyramimonas_sp.AAC.1
MNEYTAGTFYWPGLSAYLHRRGKTAARGPSADRAPRRNCNAADNFDWSAQRVQVARSTARVLAAPSTRSIATAPLTGSFSS